LSAVVRAAPILVAAGLVFLLVASVSVAGAFRRASPLIALTWAPADAGARAQLASRIAGSNDASSQSQRQAMALAADALGRDPTNVVAVRTIGLVSDAAGERGRTASLMATAERMSRRDQPTQLWMITFHGRRGDMRRMIHHFDIAMRTSNRSWEELIRLMVAMTADPSILAPLRARLVSRPGWFFPFVDELGTRGPSPDHAVMLIRGLLRPDNPAERAYLANFVTQLATRGNYDLAWAVYADARPQHATRTRFAVRNGGFEAVDQFAPFEWQLAQEDELGAFRQPSPDGREGMVLAVIAANGRSGQVARQLVGLRPGRYRLRAEMGAVPATAFDRPRINVTCADAQARTLLALRSSTGHSDIGRVGGDFSIPADCAWQWLTIHVAGQGPKADVSPWVDNLAIVEAS
jgi:hypothetical protein